MPQMRQPHQSPAQAEKRESRTHSGDKLRTNRTRTILDDEHVLEQARRKHIAWFGDDALIGAGYDFVHEPDPTEMQHDGRNPDAWAWNQRPRPLGSGRDIKLRKGF